MTDQLSQDEFLAAKKALDKCIKHVGKLASQAEDAMVSCCRSDELDARDDFSMLAGHLRAAQGELMKARSIGGKIEGNGIARSGGT